ncbi:hypothetical protein DSLASN_15220 [Desulfoluna limicola]|uniref:EF-hand domain-containing protein n=1 Tax=Desulfoluna limicola TaxID=2810562 RepID=A0ABM7PFC7_9BACT|nr:hypothetical protein [Desulfoluna limicola]BCS95890.1 hypothetical protein DSLASN_15220 [Desulfoluna limicola]
MARTEIKRVGSLLRTALVLVCVLLLTVLSVGCDDDESLESKLEEAKIAVDDGDYNRAVAILEGMSGKEALDVLSSAYAGLVGVDTFKILIQAGDGDSGESKGSIDLIGKIIGTSGDGSLTCETVWLKSSLMDQAVTALIASAGGSTALDENGQAKLGIYGFTDFLLVTGEILCFNYSDDNAQFTVTLTEAGVSALDDDFTGITVTSDQLDRMSVNMGYVKQGALALGSNNDLAEELDAFLLEIDLDGNGAVSEAEYVSFLNGLGA